MRARVHLLPADPANLRLAALATCGHACQEFPRRRSATMALLGWAPQPGLCVTPWTLGGVVEAISSHGQSIEEPVLLGDATASRPALAAIDESALGSSTTLPAPLQLRVPGLHQPARIPGEWIGTNLYLLAPLAHCHEPQRGGRPRAGRRLLTDWIGPMRSALAALATSCGVAGPADLRARAGAHIANEVFCDALCILDATWWAAAASDRRRLRPRVAGRATARRLASELVAPEHCLATSAANNIEAAVAVDSWIASLLAIHTTNAGQATPRILGRRTPWPETELPSIRPEPEGLAGRAVEALWGQASRIAGMRGTPSRDVHPRRREGDTGQTAISPRVPGRFSEAWERETRASLAEASR